MAADRHTRVVGWLKVALPLLALAPILAGLQELVPWLKQWHNDVDNHYDVRLGDHFADFIEEERRTHSLTVEDIEKVRLA